MSVSWVAATVRVRALAAGRAGRGGAADLARARSWQDAVAQLSRWSYGTRLGGAASCAGLQRSARETVLWQLRVLAGWAPANGTRILRGTAAEFERDNILMRMRELREGTPGTPYDLGALETSWTPLRRAPSPDALLAALARTPWGTVPADEQEQLPEILTSAWLLRWATSSPGAATWAARQAALVVARARFVDMVSPGPTLRLRLRPLLGHAWTSAADLPEFVATLPAGVRAGLTGVDEPADLWRAEARIHGLTDSEAAATLRTGAPRPESLVAGVALLTVDAWRIQAALAAVESGEGAREVLDAAS